MRVDPDGGVKPEVSVNDPGAADARAIKFTPARGFGRGYDTHEVDRYVARCASTVDALSSELVAARSELVAAKAELASLRAQADRHGAASAADHALSVLATAQQTADAILRQANDELERVRDAADSHLDQARRAAAAARLDSERAARKLTDEATRRTADLEQRAAARLERLTIAADLAQQDIDREADDLRVLRDGSRDRLVQVIDEVLDQVAEQYGRAHPLAGQAAMGARRRSAVPAPSVRQSSVAGRGRRALRLAGSQTERRFTTTPTSTEAVPGTPAAPPTAGLPQRVTGDELPGGRP